MPVATVVIDSIAAGGDGVGRTDGLVVFVPRTAPGDTVSAQVSSKGRFARGTLRNVVTPSPLRIDPPCPHYTRDKCGGCQLQHLDYYEGQRTAKRKIIVDSLQRIGKREVDVPPVVRSPKEWRYRTKLTLTMRRRGERWVAGLHPYDDPARIFALADCPITDSRVVAAWREIMNADASLPDAVELRGSVRITSGGPTFVLTGGRRWSAWEDFASAAPSLSALWWEPAEEPRRLLFDKRGDRSPSASFAQVNAEMADILREYVLERVLDYNPQTVIDAYSGAGHLAIQLAQRGVAVTAIELDRDASRWSAERLPAPSRAITAKVEDALPGVLPAQVVILNPPRAGVDARVTSTLELEAGHLQAVIYVSCNPPTLARDVSRLPSYDIEAVQAFDMFPQTAHVETVCILRPAAGSKA
ncbi:MAG TPA: TRAM domain-containing protein [Gemmatimonadaceae bacterium]|nr:TRAM domain-containing protein [Gemmatimonadaceae bacterium]